MKILYATRAAIPYPSAASFNTVQMCQSLVELGHDVTLVIGRKLWRPFSVLRDWASFYGFEPNFEVRRLWELPRTGLGFDQSIARLARCRDTLIYLRYPRLLPALGRTPCLLEIHSDLAGSDRELLASAFRRGTLQGVVVITHALRVHLLRDPAFWPYADRFLVAPDAVNPSRFTVPAKSTDSLRVGYVGSLYPGKGMEQIAATAKLLRNAEFEIFGGRHGDVQRWQRELTGVANVRLYGQIAPVSVPEAMDRFEIALLPNQPSVQLPSGDDIGQFTSPMKLFEYMAAGKAIIASDLPALREVLTHEENCLLVPHDSPASWAAAIRRLQTDAPLREEIAKNARNEACRKYSFTARFHRILNYFSALLPRQTNPPSCDTIRAEVG